MTGSSYVGFTYNTKKSTCDVFKTHDTSAGLATEEDTKIYVKAGEVECLASSQCPKISELSQPECVLMKCQYCRPHHLTVSPNCQTDRLTFLARTRRRPPGSASSPGSSTSIETRSSSTDTNPSAGGVSSCLRTGGETEIYS